MYKLCLTLNDPLECKSVDFIVGMCCDDNVFYIADVYLGFSYCCFKCFIFDVRHVELRSGGTKERPHQNTVNLYMYVAGRIIEWNFFGTGKELFQNFRLYSWRRNWGVIIDVFYYFYGFVKWNCSIKHSLEYIYIYIYIYIHIYIFFTDCRYKFKWKITLSEYFVTFKLKFEFSIKKESIYK